MNTFCTRSEPVYMPQSTDAQLATAGRTEGWSSPASVEGCSTEPLDVPNVSTTEPAPQLIHHSSSLMPSTSSSLSLHLSATPISCSGIAANWPSSVYTTYAFQMHETGGLPWEPILRDGKLWLRADSCRRTLSGLEIARSVCTPCGALPSSKKYQAFLKRSQNAPVPHTSYSFLSPHQMQIVMRQLLEKNQKAIVAVSLT